MRTTVASVNGWIKELKKRGISEFQFKDLPDDLRKIGMIRKAKVCNFIKIKKRIKSIAIWEII